MVATSKRQRPKHTIRSNWKMYDCEKWLELIPKLNVWMHAQLELSVSQQTEEIIRRSKRRNIEPEKENEQKIMNVCTLSIRVRQNEQPTFFQATFSICGHIINGPFLFCAAVRIRLCTKCAFFRSRSAQYTWFVFNFVGTLASYSHARVFCVRMSMLNHFQVITFT